MNGYVFYTDEGCTLGPNGRHLESLQILGFENGDSVGEAKKKLYRNNPWIKENEFIDVCVMYKELKNPIKD